MMLGARLSAYPGRAASEDADADGSYRRTPEPSVCGRRLSGVSSTQRLLVEAGVGQARTRMERLEARVAAIERHVFRELDWLARQVEALEQRAWLPTSTELQRERYEAIRHLRAEGWSVSAIAEATNVSRSRVGALVQAMPTPERVVAVNGNSYPAKRAAARRRRSIEGAAGDVGPPD
jgi:DNA-binding NarL/FixJ family response regulator